MTTQIAVGAEIKTELRSLHSQRYRLTSPLPVVVEICDDDEFIAMVTGANISMSGASATEALDLLRDEIVERYESYVSEKQLGPEPKCQLKVLEKYIGKTGLEQNTSTRIRWQS